MPKTNTNDVMAWMQEEFAGDPMLAARVEEGYRKLKLGYEIQCLREDAGLTQAQLAVMIGTSQPAIARIESGEYNRVSLTTLLKISKALGLELEISLKKKPGQPRKRSSREISPSS